MQPHPYILIMKSSQPLLTLGLLLGIATDVASSFSTVAAAVAAADLDLGKKSTAKDVLREINRADMLAPYVPEGGVAVVTGGASGIGVPSVEALALSGMKIVLACRNTADGERAKSSLPTWCQPNVRVQELDLADLSSVQRAASDILNTEGEISVLLNNAGVMNTPKREETNDGFELQLGTNHIGHHAFTRLLLPGMASGGRIVTVASAAHRFGEFDSFDDLNYKSKRMYSPWGAYGQSKLANVLFAKALDDRLKGEDTDILSVSLHPGVVATNLWRSTGPKLLQGVIKGFVGDRNIVQGAATSVYASLIDSSDFVGGEYLSDCAVAETSEKGADADGKLRQKLWEETEQMIADAGCDLPEGLLR